MNKKYAALLILVALLALAVPGFAQDTKGKEAPAGMPPMGPPEEMKQLAGFVGDWTFTMKMKMDPADTNWMESNGTANYAYTAGGAALNMTTQQDMMGMKFIGLSWWCYDREAKKWQLSWIDNMAGRISLYTGTKTDNGAVFEGKEINMGKTYDDRISISNQTATSFDWKGEMSMDGGKTWMVWATAKYTKKS